MENGPDGNSAESVVKWAVRWSLELYGKRCKKTLCVHIVAFLSSA